MNRDVDIGKRHDPNDWSSSWEDARRSAAEGFLAASYRQRFEWLEEVVKMAWASGAFPRRPDDPRYLPCTRETEQPAEDCAG